MTDSQEAGSSICFMGAAEMAQLIKSGQLSAREALAEHLTQIDRVNPAVNAIVTLVPDLARAAAAAADERQARGEPLGALHGIPVAHKDLFDTVGIRTTFGSPLFADHVPTEDDLVVDRMRRAGAIIVGKTNTPEFGAGSQTFNPVFGATRNPYDLTRTCGGSSGGSAVALACGMVPVATGTDVGGSLRNPAAFCNVVGFRPSPGRVPNPRASSAWWTFATAGCLGRSVEDVTFSLRSIAGPDARAPVSLDEPGELFARPLARDFKGTRVAWFKDLNGTPFDPQVRSIVNAHRRTFETLGCLVEETEPDFALAETAFRVLRAWNSARSLGGLFHQQPAAFKETLAGEIEAGLRLSPADVDRAEASRVALRRAVQTFFQQHEYFVLPTTQTRPFDIGLEYPREIDGVPLDGYVDWMKSCWYISATGHPAASVPAGFTREGLPVGLQIVGRDRADLSVLQMAYAFEQATQFGRRRPLIV